METFMYGKEMQQVCILAHSFPARNDTGEYFLPAMLRAKKSETKKIDRWKDHVMFDEKPDLDNRGSPTNHAKRYKTQHKPAMAFL